MADGNRYISPANLAKITDMENILEKLKTIYRDDEDFRLRNVNCGIALTVVCLDAISDDNKVCNFVLQPLAYCNGVTSLAEVQNKVITCTTVKQVPTIFVAVEQLVNGYTLVFDNSSCIAVDTRTVLGRSIAEPPTSIVMRGPREGFVEDAKSNVILLRKRLKTPNFKTISVTVGKYTNTNCIVCFIDGVAVRSVVDSIVQSLQSVTIDGVLDSSYLSHYLDSNDTLLFRRVGLTEKPDVAVGKMLEGRIAVIVDGSPMVLTLPYLFIEDLQAPGDYYENSTMTSVNRILRFASVLISVLLPALYICLQMYNYQIIPLKFLITILNATQAIPFSPLVEMLLVIVIFDILREANLRMPSAVGISLSLVGAIVLGDAAVQAGLIGAPAVMIGALSGIGLFTMPDNTLVLSLLRFALAVIGGLTGIYGVILAVSVITLYLCSLQSQRTPFVAPYAPNIPQDKQDALGQEPLQQMKTRPKSIPNQNSNRRG